MNSIEPGTKIRAIVNATVTEVRTDGSVFARTAADEICALSRYEFVVVDPEESAGVERAVAESVVALVQETYALPTEKPGAAT